jgi:lipoate-protein ligase A
VIEFLAHVGVDAKFGGKNDLKVDGYKISGNAEHVHGNRVLHHGTLLFNTSLDDLRNSIRKDLTQYSSRAVSSNPSQIRNLCDILERFSDVSEFRSEMLHYFIRSLPGASLYEISSIETMQAEAIALSKYQTWEWNWAYGPEYTFRNDFLHEDRPHSCSISVRDGIITGCTIEGSIVMNNLETKLIGCRHMVNDLLELFRQQNITLKDDEIYNFF